MRITLTHLSAPLVVASNTAGKIMIALKPYLFYKLLNSLFLGSSLGTIFVIYMPLSPKTYSIGGIFLALGAWIVSLFYAQLLHKKPYKIILLGLEILPFLYLLAYLLLPNTFFGALLIYTLYQLGFIFGDYLGRTETLIFKKRFYLSKLDRNKQIGYLLGLGIAFIFYNVLDFMQITQKEAQVYAIHFLLLLLQFIVFFTLFYAFKKGSIWIKKRI